MNLELAKRIEAARKRTLQMLEDAKKPKEVLINKQSLPSATDLDKEEKREEERERLVSPFKNEMITIGGNTFDPYEVEKDGRKVVLNDQQRLAVKLFGLEGKSGCLIGPAGTGKTTTEWAIQRAAIMCGRIQVLPQDTTHKYIQAGLPGIFGGSFTRIATRNLRDNSPPDVQGNIHTIHRLLEFEPDFKDVWDEKANKMKTIRYFRPTRTNQRKLPPELLMYNLDESSMVGTTLHAFFIAALPPGSQIVYIGDIAQLPPVMDDSILGYKLLELPVVELTHVYRHAGIIVNLANHIRVGNTIPDARTVAPYSTNLRRLPRAKVEEAIQEWNKEEDGSKVTIHLWKSRLEGEVGQLRALQNLRNFFAKELEAGTYIPEKHMILIPYNKSVGTIELNKYIGEYLGKKRGAEVFEVIAGYNKHYMAVGDKVFFDREESIITKINKNGLYQGKVPQKSSVTLDRWGHNQAGEARSLDGDEFDSIDNLLHVSVEEDDEERKNQASHVISVKKLSDFDDDGTEYTCETSAEVNNLIGGYALTIHKSQGSQWEKVYCVFHNSHNRNLQRELLYTAITRAQRELYVIAEPETFIQGVLSQHIIGNSLAEKAEYFKGKKKANDLKDDLLKNQGETE